MRPPSIPTTIPVTKDDNNQSVVMKSLYNSLIDFKEPKTHRPLINVFMSLPSRKDFPAYYSVVDKPIAMYKIRDRIEKGLYENESQCMADFELMFENCKFFNEDDSQIHKDAVTMQNLLATKYDQLADQHDRPRRDLRHKNNNLQSSHANHNSTPKIKSDRHTNNSDQANNSPASLAPNSASHSNRYNTHLNDNQNNSNSTQNSAKTNNNALSQRNDKNANTFSSQRDANSSLTKHTNHAHSNHNSSSNDINFTTPSNSTSDIVDNVNGTTDNGKDREASNHATNGTSGVEIDSNIKINHDHHNEASMDSGSNLSVDLINSTPVEKCSLNTRRGRNSDAPKRQLLTGYIIYASEIRKQVIDKNPNQNFGDISRLVGNEWKALPHEIRIKYDQRALIHNRRVREKAQRDSLSTSFTGDSNTAAQKLSNGLLTPKLTKRKLARLAKEQMRQHHLSFTGHDDSSSQSSVHINQDLTSPLTLATSASQKRAQSQATSHAPATKPTTENCSTQTATIRFVEPPPKKRVAYSESFRRYIEGLQVPHTDLLAEETAPDRPVELPTHWLGTGIGRHESPKAALWALREFMLQDVSSMRRSMEPYL